MLTPPPGPQRLLGEPQPQASPAPLPPHKVSLHTRPTAQLCLPGLCTPCIAGPLAPLPPRHRSLPPPWPPTTPPVSPRIPPSSHLGVPLLLVHAGRDLAQHILLHGPGEHPQLAVHCVAQRRVALKLPHQPLRALCERALGRLCVGGAGGPRRKARWDRQCNTSDACHCEQSSSVSLCHTLSGPTGHSEVRR